ncbi:MAG: hypothetical protein IPK83_01260 [Planctomycetes bacterium]|nr:hypothetical protein [Planctomycetota bacterium]
MNCNNTRKFLLAFADGQLSVQANCEVLDHLKMCPACSAIVDDHQSLRRSIARSTGKIAVPAELAAKIHHHVETDGAGKFKSSRKLSRPFRLTRTLVAAACVIAVALGSWQFLPTGATSTGSMFESGSMPGLTKADEITQQVIIQHNKCLIKCEHQAHQLDSLPRERIAAADAIDAKFSGVLATAAPDLSGYGYEFESANVCAPTADAGGPAAHLMYVNYSNSSYLSLFTTPHWEGVNVFADGRSPDRNTPFSHATRDCESNSMVAWHEGDMTHILVGKFDEETMAAMIRDLRLSRGNAFHTDMLAAVIHEIAGH